MNAGRLIDKQQEFFREGHTLEYQFRINQLKKLRQIFIQNEERFIAAVQEDFGKPRFEIIGTEIAVIRQEIHYHLKHLKRWMKSKSVRNSWLTFPAKNKIYPQPYGNTLIISPWNYPLQLVFMPLIGAVSAGNTVILKPSDLTSATSRAVADSITEVFSSSYMAVVEGGVETGEKLLRCPFDYIFFTGSKRVGKIVMKSAAEHLTPLTLELGGKSPVIVHHDANIAKAAKRIWWGKMINSGQSCVAPDYLLIHRQVKQEFIDQSKNVLNQFTENKAGSEPAETRIINRKNFHRLMKLIPDTGVLIGGTGDESQLLIEPTMVETDWDKPPMQEEIFGPILPVIEYEEVDNVIDNIREKPAPLALYLFTGSRQLRKKIVKDIPYGGGCVNDTLSHFGNPRLPIGGTGKSGFGSYHGKQSFITFSYQKSILKKPVWPDFSFRYPPYTRSAVSLIRMLFR